MERYYSISVERKKEERKRENCTRKFGRDRERVKERKKKNRREEMWNEEEEKEQEEGRKEMFYLTKHL